MFDYISDISSNDLTGLYDNSDEMKELDNILALS
jgi:hypothetical protein